VKWKEEKLIFVSQSRMELHGVFVQVERQIVRTRITLMELIFTDFLVHAKDANCLNSGLSRLRRFIMGVGAGE